MPDQRRRNCAALERFRLELCRGKVCGRGWCPPPAPDQHHHRPRAAPPPGTTTPAEKQSQSSSAHTAPPALAFSFAPSSRSAPAPALPRRRPDDDGDGLPDLPGLGGVGLPDEQRTACPITCPGCSFQPDTAAALLPAPLPDLPTPPAASRQPASTPPPAQRQRGQILHLTGYGFRLRA